MIYYCKIDLTKGIDLIKSKNSKQCTVCHHWYLGFKLQKSDCNGCHDLLKISPDINNIAIVTVKSVDYRCIIYRVSKPDVIHLLENSMLDDHEFISNAFQKNQY